MTVSRRNFTLSLAALGLTACSSYAQNTSTSRVKAAPNTLPNDLRPSANSGYTAWVEAFKPRARAQGISDATLSAAFRDTGYLPGVVKRDRNQTEFKRTLEEYLSIAASDERVSKGVRPMPVTARP